MSTISYAYAYEYSYNVAWEETSYTYDLDSNIVPFRQYDSFDFCVDRFSNESDNIDLQISLLNLDCPDYFLHNVANYMLQESDLKLIYSSSLDAINFNLTNILALKYNITAHPETEISELNSSAIFIGNSSLLIEKMGEIPGMFNEFQIEVQDNDGVNYMYIVGDSSATISDAINILIGLYDEYYSENNCIVLDGCDSEEVDLDGDELISNVELLSALNDYDNGMLSTFTIIDGISMWELK